jgi:hypothetical protein
LLNTFIPLLVSDSSSSEVIEFSQFTQSFRPHLALGFSQPLTEMSTRDRKIMLLGSNVRPVRRADNLTAICGILNISQPYRTLRPFTGITLIFIYYLIHYFGLCITWIIHKQLREYKVEEKLHLGVCEQKRLNTTVLDNRLTDGGEVVIRTSRTHFTKGIRGDTKLKAYVYDLMMTESLQTCLHPVACVRSGYGFFLYPSTQLHCRRLILLLILLHVSVVRPSSSRHGNYTPKQKHRP